MQEKLENILFRYDMENSKFADLLLTKTIEQTEESFEFLHKKPVHICSHQSREIISWKPVKAYYKYNATLYRL